MPALIHTLLPLNSYRVTEDGGSVRDSDGLFVTRDQKIVYRGTESSLIKAFLPGKANSPSGGSKMLCGGPQNIRLFDGTAANPHWEADLRWVGIHGDYTAGDVKAIYRIEDEFSQVEATFPKAVQPFAGGDETYFGLRSLFSAPQDPFTAGFRRARLLSYTPVKKVTGVIYKEHSVPFSPTYPEIKKILQTIVPLQATEMVDWTNANTLVPDPLYTFVAGHNTLGTKITGTGDGKRGAWVPSSLQIRRHLSVGNLYAFTMDVPWVQQITP